MSIHYVAPLVTAWRRMLALLLRPLRVRAWLVGGAAAFLAGLPGQSPNVALMLVQAPSGGRARELAGEHALAAMFDRVLTWFANPVVLAGIAIALVAFGVIAVVLAWVAARAQFVLLAMVSERRAGFLASWARAARLGRSLFLWRCAFGFAYLVPLGLLALGLAPVAMGLVRGELNDTASLASGALPIGLATLAFLALAFVNLLADDFVVPLMWRHDETATRAWARLGPLLAAHLPRFLAYALFVAALAFAAGVALVAIGLLTGCAGFVLMLTPYVGSVVLLPVVVTARALGPEFLAQFGPEWTTLAEAPAPDAPARPAA